MSFNCNYTALISDVDQLPLLNRSLYKMWSLLNGCSVRAQSQQPQRLGKQEAERPSDTPRIVAALLMDLMETLAGKAVVRLDQEVRDPTSLRIACAPKKNVPDEHPERRVTE